MAALHVTVIVADQSMNSILTYIQAIRIDSFFVIGCNNTLRQALGLFFKINCAFQNTKIKSHAIYRLTEVL